MPGFTQEQAQWILSLIETPKSGFEKLSGKKLWLLDSGASHRMTGNLSLLYNVSSLPSIPVKLSNGVEVMPTKHGMAKLNPKVILNDVLFVLGMTCNLISITQLVSEIFCTVPFLTSCV